MNARGLHAVMSRKVAEKKTRVIQNKQYPFFYNPMWNLLGDTTPGPPGTHYYRGARFKEFFWHMFDQVLIRPELLSTFDNNNLRILTSDGHASFLSRGELPDKKVVSDHLPLYFQLSL